VVAERARRASDFPALKVKVGGASDLATLEAVRAVFGGPIRVDANTGWSLDGAIAILPELQRLGVELIEQPFPAGRLDLLRELQARSPLPIVADESAVTIDDLDRLVGVVAGVNVKLAKCGGLGPARRMLERRRSRTGWTWTGPCCWPTTRRAASSWVRTRSGDTRTGRASGWTSAPTPAPDPRRDGESTKLAAGRRSCPRGALGCGQVGGKVGGLAPSAGPLQRP
jgi:L-alanine-DL-glutamate epimerase-like enolase superfamily enzyme